MKENTVSLQQKEFGKEMGFIHEGLITLRKAGMDSNLWGRLTENQELARKTVAFIRRDGFEATISQRRARQIMGEHFLGYEEVTEHFGIQLTKEELSKVAEIPFTEATLRACKDKCILFLGVNHDQAGKPLTINRFKEMFPGKRYNQPRFYLYDLLDPALVYQYGREIFAAKETPELRWYLIKREADPSTWTRNFSVQEERLENNEYRERAVVYLYLIFLMFKATGNSPFFGRPIWCADADSTGHHVFVENLGSPHGVRIGAWEDNCCKGNRHCLGLFPARKPE
jgi:hypothetical protein